MKKLFELGTEEQIAPIEEEIVTEPTMGIEDVISAEEAMQDVNECAAEIAQLEAGVEAGNEMATTVETQIAVEEALLAKPESIAASTVQLSYESMKMTAAILGADVEAMDISAESMEKSPGTALEISVEEKKELLKKIVDNVKAVLKKIWAKIKQFIGKVVLAFSGLEKKAVALQAEIGKLDGDAPKELSEALVKKIKSRNAALYMLGGSVADTLLASNTAPTKVSGLYNEVHNAIEGTDIGTDDSANAKAIEKLVGEISAAVKDGNADKKLNDDETKAVFAFSGSTFQALTFAAPELKDTYSKEAAEALIGGLNITVTNIDTEDAKIDPKPVDKKELADMINDVVTYAKKIKDYGKTIEALTSSIDKNITKLKGDKITDKAVAKVGQLLGTGVSGKLIASHLANVKNTMLLCNDLKNSFVVKSNEEIAAGEAAKALEDAKAVIAAGEAAPSVEDIEAAKAVITAATTAGEATPSVEDIDGAKAVIAASEATPSVEDIEAAKATVAASVKNEEEEPAAE